MNTVTRWKATRHQRQQGAVAITLGLTLVVLIGFAGLAIDLGRFFVIKAELQNAMDACALSAASQLKYHAHDTNALTRATAYGKVFFKAGVDETVKNKVNFQSMVPNPDILEITFASSNGDVSSFNVTDPNEAKYVKCRYPLTDLPIYFMQVLNPLLSTQTVSAMAVAKRELPIASCIPIAVCKGDKVGPEFGHDVGDWISAYDSGPYGTGNFGWIDFSPPFGGADEIKKILAGSKQCDISQIGDPVGEGGKMTTLQEAWNSRFGLYWNNTGGGKHYSTAEAPPDKSGFAYSNVNADGTAGFGNWPSGSNAYSDFIHQRDVNQPYQGGVPLGIDTHQYTYIVNDPTVLNALGRADRRVVAAPVVDCEVWNTGGAEPDIEGWACVLMLNPMEQGSVASNIAKLEFLGSASDANSPCSGGEEKAIAPVLTQ